MSGIGYIVVAIALTILRGYAFSVLWGWFIVPTFKVADLSVALAIGIAATVHLMVASPVNPNNDATDPTDKAIQNCVFSGALSIISIGFGWIVKQFV